MPNLAMRQPGTQFSGDGLDLSWPIGGEREVIKVLDEDVSLRVRRRIAEGQIVITDDKPTKQADTTAREYKLLTGDEARVRMAEPAGPVTRVVYQPATPEDEKYWNPTIQSVDMESETYKTAQAERAAAAEERHAAITQQQVAAEKAAADAAPDEEDDAEDPIALRVKRTQETSAEWRAERERLFMERETERQKEEALTLKAFDAANKKIAKGNKAAAAAKADADDKPKTAPAKEPEPVVDPLAGKTDPFVGTPEGEAAPKAAPKPTEKKG